MILNSALSIENANWDTVKVYLEQCAGSLKLLQLVLVVDEIAPADEGVSVIS